MTVISMLPGEGRWRSRRVRYYSGDWLAIKAILPHFDLVPFKAGPDEPANPFFQTVIRQSLSAVERPMPVGIVSNTYSLAPHLDVAALCQKGLLDAGMTPDELRYEVGLSELGEWMNLRIYLPDTYSFTDASEKKLDLRLECFNSVDGSSRLMIVFGWLRFVCANGLVIGETTIEIKERHGQSLNLGAIPDRICIALEAVDADRRRMKSWEAEKVSIGDIEAWSNTIVAEKWGKKAAARVYHICDSGTDIEIKDPFASGRATEKPVRYLDPVPGSPNRAATKYEVSQALSFVATHRKDAEGRVTRQADIASLLDQLAVPVKPV